MIVTRISSILSSLILPFLMFGFCSSVYAGPDPTPTDWLPQFTKVGFNGNDVVFSDGNLHIRLPNRQFGNTPRMQINNLVEKTNSFEEKVTACTIPTEILSKYPRQYKPAEIWLCDLPNRIWYATTGYCGESDDEPDVNQGHLYSYSPTSGDIVQYPGFLPECAELIGLLRINNLLVGITYYQSEYSQSAGDVITLDLSNSKARPEVLSNPNPTGAVVGISPYDKQCDCLWFATEKGIERFVINRGQWEQRYFDYEITPDNKFALTLSSRQPNDNKMWLGRVLYNYPIEDLRGFSEAWNQSTVLESSDSRIRTSSQLIPFYLSAAELSKKWKESWKFGELIWMASVPQGKENIKLLRAFIEKQLKQPMNLNHSWAVISRAKQLGIDHAQELESVYFDRLLADYFIRPRPNYSSHAISQIFNHPEYLPKLMDYYLNHLITFEVEGYFLDQAGSYRSWASYSTISETINKGSERLAHRLQLLDMCSKSETPRDESKLMEILQARLETDAQAKHMNDPHVGTRDDKCIDASFYWIGYGGADQVHNRTDLMLATAAAHRKYAPLILEALNRRYSTSFKNIEEWKLWWNSNSPTKKSMGSPISRPVSRE